MKRTLSRGEKGLGLICAVVVMGLVGIGVTRSRLDAEPDWDIPAPQPTPNPNGYELYRLAGAAIIPAVPAVDPINDSLGMTLTTPDGITVSIPQGVPVTLPPPNSPRYSLARRTAWLLKNAKVSALFERAKAADSVHPSFRVEQLNVNSYGPLKQLKIYKLIAIRTAKKAGDWNSATQNSLDLLELAGDVRRGAGWSGYGFSSGIEHLALDELNDTPAHLNASEAAHAAKRLEKLLATREPTAQILCEEKWCQLERLREIMRTQTWRLASTWGENASRSEAFWLQFLSKRQMVESYRRTADWYIHQAETPYNPHPSSPPEAGNLISRDFNPDYHQLRTGTAREDTDFALLLSRFALRAYRVKNGRYPRALGDLVPKNLVKVQPDPFGNRTGLHYRKKGNSYAVWSIGPDAKDDQGRPIPVREGQKIAEIFGGSHGDAVATPEQQPR